MLPSRSWLANLPIAALLCVWFSGCGATAPPRDLSQAEPRDVREKELRRDNHWEKRLLKDDSTGRDQVIDYGPVTVDGRHIIVRKHPIQHFEAMEGGGNQALWHAYYPGAPVNDELKRWDGDPYELVDADTGETLLPLDFWHVMAVPGRAVYVRTPEERLANRPSLKASKSRERGDLPWHTLDLDTGDLSPSDVYFVGSMNPERENATVGREYDPLVDPVALHRVDPSSAPDQPLTVVEILPPPDSVLERTVTTRVIGRPHERLNTTAGRFDVLDRLGEDGVPAIRLLADGITVWHDSPGESRLFQAFWHRVDPESKGFKTRRYLGLRSPGSTVDDDLWLLLDEFGRFGAPEGVVGFRPLNTSSGPTVGTWYPVQRWLMRYAEAQADGAVWEMRDPTLGELASEQRYRDYRIFRGLHWDTVGLDENHGIEERSYMAVEQPNGKWVTRKIGSPPPGARKYDAIMCTTDTLESAKAEITRTALKRKAGHKAAMARKLERKRERDFENAFRERNWSRAQMLAYERGSDALYRVATSMPRPSAAFLRSAAERCAESQAMELRAMAVAEEKRYAAQVAAYRARQLENERQQEEARRRQAARSRSTGYSAPRSYLAAPSTGPSYEAQQRYKRNSSYSPHARNMGWQSPYDFD